MIGGNEAYSHREEQKDGVGARCTPRSMPLLASWRHNRPPAFEVRQPPALTLEGPHPYPFECAKLQLTHG